MIDKLFNKGGHNGEGADGSDGLANNFKYYIDFFHVPTGESVQFKAFLTSFNDSYTTEWNSEDVYGRMDPIQSYKGTKRKISLEWEVVAGSVDEAKDNLAKCTALFGMLYPVFDGGGAKGSKVISNPPLMRVRFLNLIRDAASGGAAGGTAETTGLVCTINGFNYSPDVVAGFMHTRAGEIYPQLVKLSCELTVMHTHSLGYDSSLKRNNPNFPYGSDSGIDSDATATAAGNTTPSNPQMADRSHVIITEYRVIGGGSHTDHYFVKPGE